MNKITQSIAALGLLFVATQSQAALITNGDFNDSCSLSGWNQDTDGDGDIGNSDFAISGSAPSCSADVSVGDWNTSPALIANTLWQNLDLTGANDSTFLLNINFSVDSDIDNTNPDFFADIFTLNLTDTNSNTINTIFEMDIDGFSNHSFDFVLDSSYANANFWNLEFVMLDQFDSFGSTLSISNVSLTEVLAPVTGISEPTSLAIFALGFAGLAARRKHANELIRKSLNK